MGGDSFWTIRGTDGSGGSDMCKERGAHLIRFTGLPGKRFGDTVIGWGNGVTGSGCVILEGILVMQSSLSPTASKPLTRVMKQPPTRRGRFFPRGFGLARLTVKTFRGSWVCLWLMVPLFGLG